jgi:transposase-like protein
LIDLDVPLRGTWVSGLRPERAGTPKAPVLVLVETDGKANSVPVPRVNGETLKAEMEAAIDPSARIVTDELHAYKKSAAPFAGGHQTVCHSKDEYVNADGFHTNTAKSFFALLKRRHYGVFHQISKKHLPRYRDEFTFRWNGRKLTDAEWRNEAVKGAEGQQLYYKQPVNLA